MTRQVAKGSVQVGPNVYRHRKPVGAVALIIFLAIDSAKWHLLHHLLGTDSGGVAALLFLIAIVWGVWRICKRS